jgi:Flp pilus assembly protein TadD
VKENFQETGSAPETPWWNHGWVFGLFVVAATLIAYLPVWHGGFIWDDDLLLTANPLVKDPHGWYRFWWTTSTPDYFPVMSSTFWLEWRLWGMNAAGYHVVNVLLHAVNAILLWRVLTRLKIPGAKLGAAIFALHPVNVESVAWIAELKNTLSMFFFAWTLLCYLKFEDTNLRRWYWISVAAFFFALLSKTAAAPLPFILLGIAWWQRGRIEQKDLFRSAAFFGAAGLLALVTIHFQYHNAIGHDIVRTDDFWSRLAIAGRAVWFYFYKTLWPLDLSPIFPRWHAGDLNWISFVPGILLAAGFFVCWQFRAAWGKPFLFGLGYAVVMFLPVLGFVNIYYFRFSFVASHWQYFSIIGPIALAAAGITMALDHFGKSKIIFGGALLLLLGFLTWRQADIYLNAKTLWSATLEKNPDCAVAHNNLGFVELQNGDVDEALPLFEKAVLLQPDDSNAQKNLGSALLEKDRVDDAIGYFQTALKLKPDDSGARNNLGFAFFKKGRVDDAIAEYQAALKIQPDAAGVHHNYGLALFKQGRVDEAMSHYQKALEIKPDDAEVHNDIASVLSKTGDEAGAIQHWQKALEIRPQYMPAQNNLAWALATNPDPSLRNGAKAVQLAQQANQLSNGKNVLVLRTLAAAYAEAGQFTNALTTAGLALQLAATEQNLAIIQSLESQMKLYKAGQPFHMVAKSD